MNTFCFRIMQLFLWVMVTSSESWFDPSVIKTVIQGGPQDDYMFNMTNPEMIRSYGYLCEIHHVNVSNYRLEMHRIPQGLNQSIPSKGYAVLLVHGFKSSANVFSSSGPKSSIGYLLADSGYDVWLANLRGNHYSRFNCNISPDDPNFWKFSWDDYIGGDLAGMIDYILNFTGTSKLYLLGHSIGAFVVMGLLASQMEYNNKVKAVIALAPPNNDGQHQMMIPLMSSVIINLAEGFLPDGQFGEESTHKNYNNASFNFLEMESYGDKPSGFHLNSLKVSLAKSYSSTSWRVVKHNVQPEPPKYNLTKISAPVYIYTAANDKVASKEASSSLCKSIPSCGGEFVVGSSYSGHLWLCLGKDIETEFFPMVLSAMNKEEQNDVLSTTNIKAE